MSRDVIIVGAGMGGLAAAVRLARSGFRVQVLERRAGPGGLAASEEFEGFPFDAGPYILLDRPGLEWAFGALGLELAERVPLRPLTDVYEVTTADGERVRFHASLEETAAGMERTWPGSGRRYTAFVKTTAAAYRRLQPLQRVSRPGLLDLLRTGAWRNLFFLRRSLQSVLARTGLPPAVIEALSIWTHVAGQRPEEAPSPLAFVPALIHTIGAFYPVEGIGAVPRALAAAAVEAGATLHYGVKVTAIRCRDGRVSGVETDRGEHLAATAVLSDASGIGTYLDLVDATPAPAREQLRRLPLQSPGVCAYLAVRGEPRPPYLRFRLPGGGALCRLLIQPGVPVPELGRDGWRPARLMAPMAHAHAEAGGADGQRAYLSAVLAEDWWQEHVGAYRVLATRVPAEWGSAYNLYRDSMNPVMTARLMRAGRLAHRSPHVRGLYLAGSSTHPGQWVSFCAVSGVLAADRLRNDLGLMLETELETLPNGRLLRVARVGDGPPLVLLHGYPDNLQLWCELAPRLTGHRVIAFDWPGMGFSEGWPGGTTPMHQADKLQTLLDAWGLDRVDVAGLDMGGQPALVFAARHPERVRRLVVMNSLVFGDEETSWEIRLLRKFGWNRFILRWLPRLVFWRARRTFLPRGVRLPPELRHDFWESFRRPEVRAFVAKLCAGYQGTLAELPGWYRRIECPLLVLWAEGDKHFPPRHAERLHAAIPGSRLEIVPGAEHWMPWYLADEVAARIRAFLT